MMGFEISKKISIGFPNLETYEMGFENFALNCEMQPNRVPGIKNDQLLPSL